MQSSPQGSPASKRRAERLWTALCFILLFLAGAEFAMRGPVRAISTATRFNDFLSPFIQAKAWTHGLDPYSPEVLLRLWPPEAAHFIFLPKEVANGSLVAHRGIPTAYPVTAFVLIAPFSVLPWNVAYALWLGLNLILFLLMICALLALAGFSYHEQSAILFVAATLALAPFHTGIATGNVSLIAVELGVITIWTARRRHDIMGAILLAVSVGLKPQIGLCFLLYYLVRRRWRVFAVSLSILACIAALGVLRLEAGHTAWLQNYLNDNRVLLETGVLGNFTPVNPMRFGLINLQVALYPILGRVRLANGLAMLVGLILLGAWIVAMSRIRSDEDLELLDLGAIGVISLLPVYHRFYDAVLLVLPLCWVCISFRKSRMFAILSLLLMAPFLIPGGTLLERMQTDERIPSALAQHWWWGMIVMPHQVWMLLLLSVTLLWEMHTCRSSAQ
jgi:hypothetical protein